MDRANDRPTFSNWVNAELFVIQFEQAQRQRQAAAAATHAHRVAPPRGPSTIARLLTAIRVWRPRPAQEPL